MFNTKLIKKTNTITKKQSKQQKLFLTNDKLCTDSIKIHKR